MSLQTLQNINTSHQHSKNYIGSLSNKESITKSDSVFSHTKHSQINNLHIYTIVFHFRHILFLHDLRIHLFFPFHMSDHHWQKGFLCHRSTTLEFTPSWYPKLVFSTNIPFQAQNTPFQNCVPSLSSFPSPWTVYPDFDSCYSHFMPYRMTPSVRHRAIEVHYYYYYVLEVVFVLRKDGVWNIVEMVETRHLKPWKHVAILHSWHQQTLAQSNR